MTAQAVRKLASGVRGILTNWFSYSPGKTGYLFARYDNWRALIGFPPVDTARKRSTTTIFTMAISWSPRRCWG